MKTRIAGTIDCLPPESCTAALSERLAEMAAEEAIAQSSIGSRGDFPGPLFIAVAPIEIEWEQREELVRASGATGSASLDGSLWRSARKFARKFGNDERTLMRARLGGHAGHRVLTISPSAERYVCSP